MSDASPAVSRPARSRPIDGPASAAPHAPVDWLTAVAERWSAAWVWRHATFLAATLLAVSLTGYHVGTFDQVVHLPFLKQAADPGLYPGDVFVALRSQHTSYFWCLFIPFYRWGLLAPAMLIVHLAATYLTFWAGASLSLALTGRPLGALLTVAALIFPHFGLRGWPILEFSLLNRTVVLPFLIWAWVLYLRGRIGWAFALLGAVCNLHAVSANLALAIAAFDAFCQLKRRGWRPLAAGLALFLLAASPVLLWRWQVAPADFGVRLEWFSTLTRAMYASTYFLLTPQPSSVINTVCGASTVISFAVTYVSLPEPQRGTIARFWWAGLLIVGVELITAQWLPITFIVELQIIRVTVLLLLLTYVVAAQWLAAEYTAGRLRGGDFWMLAGSFLVMPAILIPGVTAWLLRRLRAVSGRHWIVGGLLAGWAGVAAAVIGHYGLWSPGFHFIPLDTAWYQAQLWARDNTPRDAVFITPPYLWGYYGSDWRVFSERSTVVSLSDLQEAVHVPAFLTVWQPRFEAVAPGALERFQGDLNANRHITAEAYSRLTAADVQAIAQCYDAHYVVLEKPQVFPGRPIYENERFVIYRVTSPGRGGFPILTRSPVR